MTVCKYYDCPRCYSTPGPCATNPSTFRQNVSTAKTETGLHAVKNIRLYQEMVASLKISPLRSRRSFQRSTRTKKFICSGTMDQTIN